MSKVIALFESQAEATRALDALHAGDYKDIETEVIEDARDMDYGTIGVAAPAPNASTGVAGVVAIPDPLQDIGLDDEEVAWFAQGIRGGGVLVVVEVDDEDAQSVERILRDHGGRTFEKA